MRVLSIMCHPDDMELKCSGTLIRYKQEGHDVISCHVANGNMGHMVIDPDELRKIRRKEAQNAAAIAGIECVSADFDDLTINAADETQLKEIIRIIRYAQPDIILTHDPDDYCSDHTEVSKLVFNASFSATCPHFHPQLGKASPLAAIYYADTDDGLRFIPTEYVDITDCIEQKAEMMRCHESQLTWLTEHHNCDAIAEMYNRGAFWGKQCGVKYAEAFRPLLVSGRMRTYRMLP